MAKVEYVGTITNKSKKDEIIQWCKDNNKVEWLKAVRAEKKIVKVYPKVPNAQGKLVEDKSAEPRTVEKEMDFLTIKRRLMAEFFQVGGKKKKAPTFLDEIDAL